MFTILDIDNCISNDKWRIKFIKAGLKGEKKYEEYHSYCVYDEPCTNWFIKAPERYILNTGRPEKFREQTVDWLKSYELESIIYKIWMRPDGDCREGWKVKESNLLASEEFKRCLIQSAYDDCPDAVNMYKKYLPFADKRFIHTTPYP